MPRPRKDKPVFTIDEKVEHKTDAECIRIGNVIKKYRVAKNMEMKQLAQLLGYTGTAIHSWEYGISRPNIEIMRALCRILDIPMEEMLNIKAIDMLPEKERSIIQAYHALSDINRESFDVLLRNMVAQQELEEKRRIRDFYKPIYAYEVAAAANFGVDMNSDDRKAMICLLRDRVPERADCAIYVNGDSAEPDFPDGCCVYVDKQTQPVFGEIGIFTVDDVAYIKRREEDGLHSINPKYAPIPINEDTNFVSVGKVLGIVQEADIAPKNRWHEIEKAFQDD